MTANHMGAISPKEDTEHVTHANTLLDAADPDPSTATFRVGTRVLDAADPDPARRPSPVNEADVPARIPRVPALLVETEAGPQWQFAIDGTTTYTSGRFDLPKLIHKRGRNWLLVDAEA